MEYKTLPKNSILTCPLKTVIKSVILSYVISIILFLLLSFVITYTKIPYSVITPSSIIITLLSILTAGIINGKKSNEKGWLTGCITGFVYMFILYIAGSLIFKTPNISSYGIIMIIIGMLSGITGSIIGINNKIKTVEIKELVVE